MCLNIWRVTARYAGGIKAVLRVMCPIFLSDFNKNWNALKNLSGSPVLTRGFRKNTYKKITDTVL